MLHQYLVNFFIFRLVRLLRKYHADFFFPCSPNCHVGISCAFSFPFCPIATLVSRALFVFPIVQSLRYYLVGLCFLVRLLRNCISCTFCFPACPIVSFLSCAPFVFVPVQYLLLYHVHFLYSFLSKCNVTIICTFSKFSSKIPLVKNSCSFQHFPKSFS